MTNIIAILGGTFDPVHNGHLHIANELIKKLALREVRLLPCYQPVHRDQPIASPEHRLAMLKLAVIGNEHIAVDETELHRQGPSYMIDTLPTIRDTIADRPLALIIGTDAFAEFNTWKDWQDIIQHTHLIIVNRANAPNFPPEINELLQNHGTNDINALTTQPAGLILQTTISEHPASATAIRQQLARGETPTTDQLPQSIIDYITVQNLYK